MTPPSPKRSPKRRLNHSRGVESAWSDRSLLGNLAAPVTSPDMTRSIMGRLGYMKVSAKISRRRKMQRWIGRGGMTAAAGLALLIGVSFYQNSSMVRRAESITIPQAVGNEFQRLDNAIKTIQNIAPRMQMKSLVPRRGVEPREAETVNDDVNRSPIAPQRWV